MSSALRGKALRLLARRERSRAELARLLDPQGANASEVSAVLDVLQQDGSLSDVRLAEHVLRAQRPRRGALRIRHEMARRGLPAEVITSATNGLEDGDLAAAFALWQKRFGQVAAERAERERQLRFLLNRGFSRSTALKVLRQAGAQDAIDSEE
jgi:regulatory protein